ncbi:MAG: thioredoxin fold domain-containing protein [Desulfuromonadaceae bacterium]|nr:thioredoxin fold domain-containing protein [Desulfuromonadaceae bacterium]MDD5106360.1 thioredoxin fold domain-containing protein [Desulfuromonadaceae bacterium]
MKKLIILLTTMLFFAAISQAATGLLDYTKAVTIGSGPKIVVEFTDPDCPFCRKASKYFDGRSDITRHVFFYPLPRHPKSKEKAQYVLSQADSTAAYHAVMSGSMDMVQSYEGITPKGIKLQEEQLEIVKGQKVKATPTFLINGRIIVGFDQKKFDEALGN